MKYYAVTEDPNELMHYGVKGMKWGQHIFGDRPKSAAYKRAAGKLSSSMRNGIAKARANWKAAHSPAVMRAKAKVKALKKEQRAFRRDEKKMNKAIQKAREGRLRYGKLTDDQVRRVTERLALEQRARQLGSTEKPKFSKRMKEAVKEGMLKGTVQGTSAMLEEIARAKAQSKFGIQGAMNRRALKKKAKFDSKIKAKADRDQMKEDLKNEVRFAREQANAEAAKELYKVRVAAGKQGKYRGRSPAKKLYKIKQKQTRKLNEQNGGAIYGKGKKKPSTRYLNNYYWTASGLNLTSGNNNQGGKKKKK